MINLSRFFEFEAQNQLPTSKGEDGEEAINSANIFNPLSIIKLNFKNCLSVVSRNLESLIMKGIVLLDELLDRIINSIARVRQKVRPNRVYPRISHKPRSKWSYGLTEYHDIPCKI